MYYDKKKITIVIMMIVILFMAVVYAAFSSSLSISGIANIDSNWNVYISSVITKNVNGKAENAIGSPSFSNLTAVMSVNLKEPGDYIEYEVTISNGGTLDSVIDEIEATSAGTDAIVYSISNIQKGDKITAGSTKVFSVKIEYDVSITSQPEVSTKVLSVNVNCVQDLNQNIDNEDITINNATITTLSGSNNLSLSNSAASFLNNYRITGNSIQNGIVSPNTPIDIESVGTKTVNLFDFSLDNITKIHLKEGTEKYGFDFGVLEPGEYTLSFELVDSSKLPSYVYFVTKPDYATYSYTYLTTTSVRNNPLKFTADGTSSYSIVCASATISNLEMAKKHLSLLKNLQLEEGSSQSDYEPYDKYKLSFNVKSENMFDKNFTPRITSSYLTATATDKGIKLQSTKDFASSSSVAARYIVGKISDYVGKKLTFAFDFKSSGQKGRVIFTTGNEILETNEHIGGGIYYTNGSSVVQTTDVITQEMADNAEWPYIVVTVYYQDREATKTGDFAVYDNFRVYAGEYNSNTMPRYVPYYNNTDIIYLEQPLRCIGETCDYLDFYTKQIVRNVRSLDLNVIDMSNEEDYPGWQSVKYLNRDYPSVNSDFLLVSSVWSNISSLNEDVFGINTIDNNSKLWLKKEKFNLTQTEWLTNYPNLNVNVLYKLAKPEIIDIDLPNIYIPSGDITLTVINKNGVEVPILVNYYKK